MPDMVVKKESLKDQAYSRIKERIQDTTFSPDEFLSERKLSLLLGMSKTPIKAALERLEQEGFVRVSPQQGIIVRELSMKEVADQFELRSALEVFVVRAVAGQLTNKQSAEIERNLVNQHKAAKKDAVRRLVELDAQFHLMLCNALGNQAIIDCLAQHQSRVHRVIFEVMSKAPGRLTEAVAEHEEIFAAVQDGQAAKGVKLLKQHLQFGMQYMLSPNRG